MSSEILAISADFTFLYPCAATTTYEFLILIPKFFASSIISDSGFFLESKTTGSTPCFLNSIAVSYPLSLFVNTNGFLPTKTPYTFKYSLAAEESITPGVSLFPKTIGLSIDPEEIKTSFARMYHNLLLG